jgi:hypothetical protein
MTEAEEDLTDEIIKLRLENAEQKERIRALTELVHALGEALQELR